MRKLIPALAVAMVATFTVASVATAHADTEHFSFVTTSIAPSNPVLSVIATGAFTDGGTATIKSKATTKRKGVLVLHLSAGTIIFQTAKVPADLIKSETATTCIQTQTKRGHYTITGGTGAYQGIAGSGHSVNVVKVVEPRVNGDCASASAAVQGTVAAGGPVTLP